MLRGLNSIHSTHMFKKSISVYGREVCVHVCMCACMRGLLKRCEIYPGTNVSPSNICGKMVGVILNQCFGTSTGVTASVPRLQQNKTGMDRMWTDRAVEAEEHALIVEKEGQVGSLIKKLRIPSLLT